MDSIYTKDEILQALRQETADLITYLSNQEDIKFNVSNNGKWSPAQQLDHLTKSIRPLVIILTKPKFIMRWLFGLANRESKTYQQLVEKYSNKIALGGEATSPFRPKDYPVLAKQKNINRYAKKSAALTKIIGKISEEDLDKYILPHPLLGKITLREMMFFTIHHTQHHHESLINLYG